MHAGPTIERDGDVFGRTVNLAARVVDQAGADEVVFTRSVLNNLVEQPVGISSLGLRRLRHIAKPVELFRLSLEPQAGAAMDPVCRMRVPSDSIQASLELADKHVVFCSDACKEAFLEDPHAFTGSQQACASS
jgi:YHS domain-containing protein